MTSNGTSLANASTSTALWLLVICAAVNLYLLGAAAILQVVQYPLLGDVGGSALPSVHAALTRRLGVVFILPEFLAFLSVLPLFWLRPPELPAVAVWACLALGIAYFVITFGWHLPAHKLLSTGDSSTAALRKLLVSHAARTTTVALKCGILLWMIAVARR